MIEIGEDFLKVIVTALGQSFFSLDLSKDSLDVCVKSHQILERQEANVCEQGSRLKERPVMDEQLSVKVLPETRAWPPSASHS